MSKKKNKTKSRRRAKKYQDLAWEAAADGNLQLAHKQIQHALGERQDNPLLWNDAGLILEQMGHPEEAEKSFRNAILIGPGMAEAYANLASLVARQGRTIQAERLQCRAVENAPKDVRYREQLEVYRALLPEPGEVEEAKVVEGPEIGPSADEALRLARYDWAEIEHRLNEQGFAVLEELLTPAECADLRSLYEQDGLFENTVELDGEAGSHGAYRFFRRPLPPVVQRAREGVYARVVPIVNRWSQALRRFERWPPTLRAFLDDCAAAGQTRTTPILLRYRAPAVNPLHRDLWGRVYFPLQLAVTLSSRPGSDTAEGFGGGEFLFADQGASQRARSHEVPTSLGDGVIFCTRDRLVRKGRKVTLQPVEHGMAPLTEGERFVVGIPFHEYR